MRIWATTGRRFLLILVGLFSWESSFLVSEGHAIPAFARELGFPCNAATCQELQS